MRNFSKPRTASLAIVGVVLLSLFAGSLSASGQTPTKRRKRQPRVVVKAGPPTRVINAEEMQSLFKRDGTRPLLVNFWATWCDPCREEFPDLVKIDRDYRPRGLDFIAISLDDLADLKTAVPKFLREMRATMPNYLLNVSDPEPAIKAVDPAWDGALPATFLYNQKGEVVYKHFGRVNTAELRAAIEKVMKEK